MKILSSPARFKVAVCGRRWGKTAAAMMAAVAGHGPVPGQLKGAIDGGTILWVGPTLPQIKSTKIWKHLEKSLGKAATSISQVDKEIYLPGGGSITLRSADGPDSLLGAGLDGLILDEASRIKPEVWHETLRPMLSDKQGWCIFITTPNGKNWFHKLFLRAGMRPGWAHWQCPSSENPLITPEELAELEDELGPRAFSQEHGAQFTDIEGALFPSEYFEDHIWVVDNWPAAFEVSCLAIDPSMGNERKPGDYSALVFAGVSGGKLWVECDLAKRPPTEIVKDAYRMFQRLKPTVVACESNGFQGALCGMFDLWCQSENLAPLPLVPVNHHEKKEIRIQRLDPYLARQQIRFRRTKGSELTVEQTQMFPDKAWNDDGPDALEMAIRTIGELNAIDDGGTQYESAYV